MHLADMCLGRAHQRHGEHGISHLATWDWGHRLRWRPLGTWRYLHCGMLESGMGIGCWTVVQWHQPAHNNPTPTIG